MKEYKVLITSREIVIASSNTPDEAIKGVKMQLKNPNDWVDFQIIEETTVDTVKEGKNA